MHFLDQAKIFIKSGWGGPGAVSFRREKYEEYGGPDGGNGGKGGDIIFEAVQGLNTLIDFRYTQHFKAQRGTPGMGKNRYGAGGKDLIIQVPVGTQILSDPKPIEGSEDEDGIPDYEDQDILADFTEVGQRVTFLRGGDGGRGNMSYKTSTNRAPRQHGTGALGNEDALDPVVEAIHRLVDKLTATALTPHLADLIRDNTLMLVLLALGDSQMGGPMAGALGLPREKAREMATRSLTFALMQEAATLAAQAEV